MRWCLPLAFNPIDQWIPLARAAEAAGFEAVLVSDHLVYPQALHSAYPYTDDGAPRWASSTPWPDPLVAIGAMGAATTRLQFITSIFILPLRHPVVAAKQVATAAAFAGGRLTLGVGAGWMREEFDLLGEPFSARGRRLAEAVDVMEKLWAGGPVEHHGAFYDFDALELSPVPPSPVPIWGGGHAEAALRRAATRFDGWASEIQTRAELHEVSAKLRAHRAASDCAGRPFSICAAVRDAFTPEHIAALTDDGVTHLTTVPWLLYGETGDVLEPKCDAIARFGAETIGRG